MTGRIADQRVEYPVSLQTWQHLTFLHWPIEAPILRGLLPAELEVDTHGGQAWAGVTPFRMRGVRAPGAPALPGMRAFGEVNVRTYVRGPDGRTGIWFFSLDCDSLPVVTALRAVGLPYHWAKTTVDRVPGGIAYCARRRSGGAGMGATVRVGAAMPEHDTLTTFLTGRWSAYVARARRLWRVPVEHEPWPLHAATADADVGGLLAAAGLPAPARDPLAHFSPGVRVRIGAPRPA